MEFGRDDLSLLRLKAGDESAWRVLYALVEGLVKHLAVPPGVNRDDLVADTVSVVFERIETVRDESCLASFCRRIADRVAWRLQQSSRRTRDLDPDARIGQDPWGQMERDDILQRVIERLPSNDWELLRATRFQRGQRKDIAKALDISPAELSRRVYAMRRLLERLFRDAGLDVDLSVQQSRGGLGGPNEDLRKRKKKERRL